MHAGCYICSFDKRETLGMSFRTICQHYTSLTAVPPRKGKRQAEGTEIQVAMVAGFHLFPFRTEKLSPPAPMVLHTRGRVGSRRF